VNGVAPAFDAVELAGGRGRRMGEVDKASLRISGDRLVDRVLRAARGAGASRIVAVGPPGVGDEADVVVREDPPFSGPLAGLAAALAQVRAPWVMILACDLVDPAAVVAQLRPELAAPASSGASGVILIDEEHRRQWLAGCYRAEALRAIMAGLPQPPSGPIGGALGRLALREVVAAPRSTGDIDTLEQLADAIAASRKADT